LNLPETLTRNYTTLVSDIKKGEIKIPQFQRDFVWNIKKSAELLDSIVKGYPIGTFIFWKTKERLRTVKEIGNQQLPEPREGDFVDFVLDGQQRITSLFASLEGLTITRSEQNEDFASMYLNLEAEEDEEIVTINKDNLEDGSFIRLHDLLHGDLKLLAAFDSKYHGLISEYKRLINAYNFSIIQIREAPIDIATEIFTRINIGGKPLSLFEIMVAKTFDADKNFDLSEKYNELIEKLGSVDYDTISDATVLQTVSIILTKDCSKKQILKLEKRQFIEAWDSVIDAIETAADYFRTYFKIPVSKLLPYNALVVPFAYFFYHHKDKPVGDMQKYLGDMFWRLSLTGRYSSGVEGKLAQDIKKVDLILEGKLPKYDWPVNYSKDFIENNGWFNAGHSFIKAILCLYAYQMPKSFSDNAEVIINNDWLKQSNSKNYHHFFPRAYLEKRGQNNFYINHIVNITIVDDFLNKRQIGADAPSKYMKKFQKINKELAATMKTHLITELDKFGIWADDYDSFFKYRLNEIHKELKKRIIPQEIDNEVSEELPEEYDE
jgi:hypothetical protein